MWCAGIPGAPRRQTCSLFAVSRPEPAAERSAGITLPSHTGTSPPDARQPRPPDPTNGSPLPSGSCCAQIPAHKAEFRWFPATCRGALEEGCRLDLGPVPEPAWALPLGGGPGLNTPWAHRAPFHTQQSPLGGGARDFPPHADRWPCSLCRSRGTNDPFKSRTLRWCEKTQATQLFGQTKSGGCESEVQTPVRAIGEAKIGPYGPPPATHPQAGKRPPTASVADPSARCAPRRS